MGVLFARLTCVAWLAVRPVLYLTVPRAFMRRAPMVTLTPFSVLGALHEGQLTIDHDTLGYLHTPSGCSQHSVTGAYNCYALVRLAGRSH